METTYKTLITFGVLILVVGALYYGTELVSKSTGFAIGEDAKVQLAQCMAGKNINFYYSRFCADCYEQKIEFGTGFRFLNVIDCDNFPEKCTNIDSEKMPAWKIDGKIVYGYKDFNELRNVTGCSGG